MKMPVKEKSDDELKESAKKGLYTSVQATKAASKKLQEYAKRNKVSKTEALSDIVDFLHATNIGPDEFWKVKDTVLIPKYHDFTAGFLQKFEANYLQNHQQFYNKILRKVDELQAVISYNNDLISELFEINKLILGGINYDEPWVADHVQIMDVALENLRHKYRLSGATLVTITGRVGVDAKVITSKENHKGAVFTVAEQLAGKEVRWYNVQIWEDKLAPGTDAGAVLASFKAGDSVTFRGYEKLSKFVYKEGHAKAGQEGTSLEFVVQEILAHAPKKQQK